jgi:hypothetical protein
MDTGIVIVILIIVAFAAWVLILKSSDSMTFSKERLKQMADEEITTAITKDARFLESILTQSIGVITSPTMENRANNARYRIYQLSQEIISRANRENPRRAFTMVKEHYESIKDADKYNAASNAVKKVLFKDNGYTLVYPWAFIEDREFEIRNGNSNT